MRPALSIEPKTGVAQLKWGPAKVALIYAAAAALWVVVSDHVAGQFAGTMDQMALVSTGKGWAFVAVTTPILYGLMKRLVGDLNRAHANFVAEQNALQQVSKLLALVSEKSTDAIYVKDITGRYLLFNREAGRFVGKDCDDVVGHDDRAIFPPDEAAKLMAADQAVMESGQIRTFEEVLTTPNGVRTFLATKGPLFDGQGTLTGLFGIARDISERKKVELALKQREKEYRSLFQSMLGGFAYHRVIYDQGQPVDFEYLAVNANFEGLTGLKNVIGRRVTDVIPGLRDTDPDLFEIYFRVAETGIPERFEKYIRLMDQWFFISVFSTDREHFAVLFDNITERKQVQQRIEFLAFHDTLTGLPNRLLAEDRMIAAITRARQAGSRAALLFLDLDNFKTVNETFGHQFGDDLLKLIAVRFGNSFIGRDHVCRNGGDEFLFVLPEQPSIESIGQAAEQILALLTAPFTIHGRPVAISASIGIALYPDDGHEFETILRKSDTARHHAKEIGRNTYRFFERRMAFDADETLRMRHSLLRALEQNEFILYYQPQVDLAQGAVVGFEALIRWSHPDLGLVPPARFISIAEDNGLIVPIGEWVLREACRQLAAWHRAGWPGLTVAVNLSALQFKRGNLEQVVTEALAKSGLDPTCLELELTESILIKDVDSVLATVARLKELGLKLSIDDFGTGYSSLAYLKRFKVDKLKIDRSFVADLISDSEIATIVRTIIQMAASMNLRTIAEGVENEATLDRLRSLNCQEAQGFHLAHPMPADAVRPYLLDQRQALEPGGLAAVGIGHG